MARNPVHLVNPDNPVFQMRTFACGRGCEFRPRVKGEDRIDRIFKITGFRQSAFNTSPKVETRVFEPRKRRGNKPFRLHLLLCGSSLSFYLRVLSVLCSYLPTRPCGCFAGYFPRVATRALRVRLRRSYLAPLGSLRSAVVPQLTVFLLI